MNAPCSRRLPLLLLACASPAWAVPTCTVASGGALSFGAVVALASTPDVQTNSGASFWVNCTSDVASTPAIYSATARTMTSGGNSLPFALSAVSAGGPGLPTGLPGAPLAIAKDGSNETVTLYGEILTTDFKGLPSGQYSQSITITVVY